MDLSGTWRAVGATEELRRQFPAPDLDDSGWAAVEVPGHWRSSPAFAAADGPLLYRRRFEAAAAPGRRYWLVFDGVFYQGDVWLDGGYLGDTEGYFFPHAFEVTGALGNGGEHVLAVEVACSPPGDRTAKRNLTGVFEHSEFIDPAWNPGGIWRPVRVEESGPVRITLLRCLCPEATEDRATLRFAARVDAAEAVTATIRTEVGDHDHEAEHPLAAGENLVEWRVTVDAPRLWWPRALGDQVLHDVEVRVLVPGGDGGGGEAADGTPSDRRRFRTGLRQVRMDNFVMRVNGERLFLKGTNLAPTRAALAEATPAELRADVGLAAEAGLDLVRLNGHVTRPEVYDAADEAGILVWQDLPLQWGYARGVRRQAVRQAREAVHLLGHHPSLAVWCGHNEPFRLESPPGGTARAGAALSRRAAAQGLPTWNKSILDASIRRALGRSDPTRPVVSHSGVLPHPGSGGTDAHLHLGWHHGDERDLPALLALWPRLARFVSEFGAQAVPDTDGFCEPQRWPDLDWERLAARHGLRRDRFDARVPPSGQPSFEAWKAATQRYQATLVKHHVETLRRLKYRPAGGFAQFFLADAQPAVSASVLDHDRRPKAAYAALREACAPVIVVADRPPARCAPGDSLALDVHVVNDRRSPLDGVIVTARLSWPAGAETWRWQGDVGADACARVGTIQAVAPDTEGPLRLDLRLRHRDAAAENRYDGEIVR